MCCLEERFYIPLKRPAWRMPDRRRARPPPTPAKAHKGRRAALAMAARRKMNMMIFKNSHEHSEK
jgi:hypothetical protein